LDGKLGDKEIDFIATSKEVFDFGDMLRTSKIPCICVIMLLNHEKLFSWKLQIDSLILVQ